MKNLLITIDGPAGAGKSTVSKKLSSELDYRYIDTGALYRGIALNVINSNIDYDDEDELENLCKSLNFTIEAEEKNMKLFSNEIDISGEIRTPEISMMASKISSRPVIRKFLLEIQKKLGNEKRAVFEGRDMGTVVFPNADIKFYLDSSYKIRAKRRFDESDGIKQTLEEVEADILKRDHADTTREEAPLKKADDAVYVDASYLDVDEVVAVMIAEVKNKLS